MKHIATKYDETHTKLLFPSVIVTVHNSKVDDMVAAHKALKKVFTGGKLAEILATLADAWFNV